MKKNLIVVTGPTAVGKTEIAEILAKKTGGEIINVDVGQFYAPLSIGTAKPDLKTVTVPHHLFNVKQEPEHYTVVDFNEQAHEKMQQLWQQEKTPMLVGGSVFYIYSLLFPVISNKTVLQDGVALPQENLWQHLKEIDPIRAQILHPNDTYRIKRALFLYYSSGKKPSAYKPKPHNFFDHLTLIILDCEKSKLYERINERVVKMIQHGWIEETKELDDSWIRFLQEKKIIGYDDIIAYLKNSSSHEDLIKAIQKKTRNYAKRQGASLRRLSRHVEEQIKEGSLCGSVHWLDLTEKNFSLYIDELLDKINDNSLNERMSNVRK